MKYGNFEEEEEGTIKDLIVQSDDSDVALRPKTLDDTSVRTNSKRS